jgi:hypothetical protein
VVVVSLVVVVSQLVSRGGRGLVVAELESVQLGTGVARRRTPAGPDELEDVLAMRWAITDVRDRARAGRKARAGARAEGRFI